MILRDKDGQKVLPIWVGVFEANAIALQIENVTPQRPMTHDLLNNVIHDLKADIQKIVVSDLKENTFYALIYVSIGGEVTAIDEARIEKQLGTDVEREAAVEPFGRAFFLQGDDISASLETVAAPSTYALGPGDVAA